MPIAKKNNGIFKVKGYRRMTLTVTCFIASFIIGVLCKESIVGSLILATGILNAIFASKQKRINYIYGLICYLLTAYVSFLNGLYGLFFFYIFIFSPLQIQGYISCKKNLNKDKAVNIREFTFKNSIIITTSCVLGSIILGYILSQIPSQQLAFMDATTNCINLCGVILMILRFKECWWLWLINNIVDLAIWIIIFINEGEGATMVLLSCIAYLLINIYGIIKWEISLKSK